MHLLESPRQGDSNKYTKRMFSWRITLEYQWKNTRPDNICADQIDVITNFPVITNVDIKRVHCTLFQLISLRYHTWHYLALSCSAMWDIFTGSRKNNCTCTCSWLPVIRPWFYGIFYSVGCFVFCYFDHLVPNAGLVLFQFYIRTSPNHHPLCQF